MYIDLKKGGGGLIQFTIFVIQKLKLINNIKLNILMLKRIIQKSQLLPLSKNSSFNYYFAANNIPKYSFLDT